MRSILAGFLKEKRENKGAGGLGAWGGDLVIGAGEGTTSLRQSLAI